MQNKDLKIFMVEDNEFFAHMVAEALSHQYHYKVEVFYSGEAMLERIHEKPDVMLLDFQLNSASMENMDGDKVLECIKKASPDTYTIMISSQSDLQRAVELLKLGACNYICKDLQSVHNIANTLSHVEELTRLKKEVQLYKDKTSKERKRIVFLISMLVFGAVTSYYLG